MDQPPDFAFSLMQWALLSGSIIVWAALFERLAVRRSLVEYEPRAAVPWSGIDLIVLGALALGLQAVIVGWAAHAAGVEPDVPSAPVTAALVASRLAWLVFALVYLLRKVGAYADDLGFDTRQLASDLWLAGWTFLAAVLPVYGTQYLLTSVLHFESEHPLAKLVKEQPSAGVLVLTTIAAIGVAPLVEEFLLRVLLQGWLEKKQAEYRQWRGGGADEPPGFGPIIIGAAVFAVLHGWPDGLALFVLSLFMGYVYQRTHRIIAPLAVHMCVNALAMLELWRLFLTRSS